MQATVTAICTRVRSFIANEQVRILEMGITDAAGLGLSADLADALQKAGPSLEALSSTVQELMKLLEADDYNNVKPLKGNWPSTVEKALSTVSELELRTYVEKYSTEPMLVLRWVGKMVETYNEQHEASGSQQQPNS